MSDNAVFGDVFGPAEARRRILRTDREPALVMRASPITEGSVTPAMASAGASVLAELLDSCSLDYLAEQVYIAMSAHHEERPHQGAPEHPSSNELQQ